MSHRVDNDNDADTAKAASLHRAKEDFRTIMETIDELRLSARLLRLHRAHLRLRRERKGRRQGRTLGIMGYHVELDLILPLVAVVFGIICIKLAMAVFGNTNDKVNEILA